MKAHTTYSIDVEQIKALLVVAYEYFQSRKLRYEKLSDIEIIALQDHIIKNATAPMFPISIELRDDKLHLIYPPGTQLSNFSVTIKASQRFN